MIASNAVIAQTYWTRLIGLLFTKDLPAGYGLFLSPCQAIHMLGMAYAIDALFLDAEGEVVGLAANLKPWAVSKIYPGASGCLELPAGTIADTNTGLGDIIERHPAFSCSQEKSVGSGDRL